MSLRKLSPEAASLLFLIGIFLLFLGTIITAMAFFSPKKVEGAGLILIGPFPIIFQGEINPFLLLFLIILPVMLFALVAFFFLYKIAERREEG
ncbi:MAG: DUF131 domain-containing protein [Thaumarchaeota archaeon]|nr:DUF131 domain-containing protein [Nitrososphaerota archaeon]